MSPRNDFNKYSTDYYRKLLEEEEKKHKKPEKNSKKKNLAKKILIRILEATDAYDESLPDIRSCQSAWLTGGYELVAEIEDAKERKYLRDELRRLKNQRFLKERKRGERLELCLTEKGRKAALRHKILECNNILKDRYCIVIFDIPESERCIRNFFRRFLKEAGFIQLQKSVWVTQKNLENYLIELIQTANAEKWFHVIMATKISNFYPNDEI
ncbi:MAG: CRISPR-associated endonuclease Cas2 [Patescibacteria group bacterium]|nr:CRISPR-associated endonuclease Cas2 [Patescibacteria group bacterium]